MLRATAVAVSLLLACGGAAREPASPKGNSADVDARLARIEAYLAKNAAAIEFLGVVFDQQQKQQAVAEEEEAAPDAIFAVAIADSVQAGLVDGPPTAAVTIVKAFDFTCPHCMRASDVMSELVKDYGGRVRVVFKNLVVHPNAQPAHLASCAAAKQGKYVAFKNLFWAKGYKPFMDSAGQDETTIDAPATVALAKELKLDAKRFEADMKSPACSDMIARDKAELDKFKVTGTPTFFVNGLMIPGALPKEAFKTIIDEKLKLAEASGVPAAQYYDREILGKGEKQFRSAKQKKPAN